MLKNILGASLAAALTLIPMSNASAATPVSATAVFHVTNVGTWAVNSGGTEILYVTTDKSVTTGCNSSPTTQFKVVFSSTQPNNAESTRAIAMAALLSGRSVTIMYDTANCAYGTPVLQTITVN